MGGKDADAGDIVRRAVGSIFIGADIDAENAGALAVGEAPQRGFMASVVEAEPIDDALIVGQPEYARFRIPGLRESE